MAIFKKLHKRTGVEFYYIRFCLADGRRKKECAGTTPKQAQRLLKKRLGEVASGTYVDPRRVPAAGLTFGEFADRFVKEYASLRRSRHYADRLKPLKARLGERILAELRREDLDLYSVHRSLEVGASTLRKELIVLGTMFRMAVRWGVLEASPAVDLRKPSEPKHRTRYLSRDEWDALKEKAPEWLRPILTLAVATGMRLKEIVSLRWDDYDREAAQLHASEQSKTGTRAVPVGEVARAVLAGVVRRVRCPYIFSDSAGEPYATEEARMRITKATIAAMKAAGIEGASFHTLRHTAASWLVMAGAPLFEVQKVLGHSTPAVTQRYAHLAPEHLRGTIGRLDAALLAPAPQPDPKAAGDNVSC